MYGDAMSGWERERIRMGDPVIPDWLTDPAQRQKWLSISDAERSDWARAHGTAVASSAGAAAAEREGEIAERVQALVHAYDSRIADIPASVPIVRRNYAWVPWALAAGVGGYLLLRRPRRRK